MQNVKFIYSEEAKNFAKSPMSYVVPIKSAEETSQHFVAFSAYKNFLNQIEQTHATYHKS